MSRRRLRFPWIRNRKKTEPELPVKPPMAVGGYSNGEIFVPYTERSRWIERLILQKADEGARKHGVDRREFLASTMGMATTLWVLNFVQGCSTGSGTKGGTMGRGGKDASSGTSGPEGMEGMKAMRKDGGGTGGPSDVMGHVDAGGMVDAGHVVRSMDGGGMDAGVADAGFDVGTDPTDPEQVCEKMLDPSKEFIFDIQTHHVNRTGSDYESFLQDQPRYTNTCQPQGMSTLECFSRDEYARLMFLESDTTVAVLSGLPAATESGNPITNAEIAMSRDYVNMLAEGSQRLINHHMVLPNQMGKNPSSVQAELDEMEHVKNEFGFIGAWKCYPAWGPENTEQNATGGYFLDDEDVGIPFVEKGIELGVPLFCIHKGLPIPGFSAQYNDPEDIGRIAKMYPEANFVVYHSGFGNQGYLNEGPYSEGSRAGTDSLITSMRNNNVQPNANVYAELGTTWQLISGALGVGMQAAHVIGKLLKHVGEDNVLWGTDSIWYGSPQSQIESFLAFTYSSSFAQTYGYPELTMERKRKILGLNAAKVYGIDPEATRCAVDEGELASAKRLLDAEEGERRWAFERPAIRTRRQFMMGLRKSNFRPG